MKKALHRTITITLLLSLVLAFSPFTTAMANEDTQADIDFMDTTSETEGLQAENLEDADDSEDSDNPEYDADISEELDAEDIENADIDEVLDIEDEFEINTLQAAPTQRNQLEAFVIRLYNHTMSRTPAAFEVDYHVNNLLSGAPGAQVAYGFFFSPEFIGRNLNNSNYVNTLYRVFFDRTPASFERSYWVDMLAGGWPREDIFAGFSNSNEFDVLCRGYGIVRGTYVPPAGGGARAFVTRLYDHTMSRTPAAFEVDYHVNNLLRGAPGVSVAYGFFFSPEFVGRNLNNTNYVNTLYSVFFDRTPSTSERSYWLDRLVAYWPREDIFAGFANSNEFANLCSQFGIVRGTYTPPPYGFERVEVLRLVNIERARNGLRPLSGSNSALGDGAVIRAKEIIVSFSHTRPDGRSPWTAYSGSYRTMGENIAMGYSSPQSVVTAWMNSPGHRANILNGSYTHLGVGVAVSGRRLYWVQLFLG